MRVKQKQRGVSPIGVLLIMIVAGFFIMCAVKIVPLYQDFYLAKGVLDNLEDEPDMALSVRKIQGVLERRLSMNAVRSLSMDDFLINVDDNMATVELAYEARVALMFNLDVVAKFDHVVEIDLSGR